MQATTFIVFLVLFVYGFINAISGNYVLKGNLYVTKLGGCAQAADSCSSYAKYYDVRWGTREFASNSKGEYYITIGSPEYFSVLPRASHELTFIKDEQVIATKDVHFSRWGSEFNDVTLQSNPPANVSSAPMGRRLTIIPVVWADSPPGNYRLLVQGIRFSGGPQKADASLELSVDANVIDLKDHLRGDMPAGHIPLVMNQNLDLDSSFYFPLPGVNSLPTKGTIKLTVPGGFFQFSNSAEQFYLPTQQALGQSLQVTGTRGSTITIRIVLSSDVKVFKKSDLVGKREQLEAELLDNGFLVHWTDSPQGFVRETNALWTGQAVPVDIVKRLIKVVIDQNIAIKKIEYQYRFASTLSANEMQFGYSASCLNSVPIPKPALQNALAVNTEAEFKKVIASVSTCRVAGG